MNVLKQLEEKLICLAELVKDLKTENAKLAEENAQLSAQLIMLQNALKDDSQRLDALKQEKELTRLVVDDLIKSIDSLVENPKLV
jgi:regulator of replication initiation timing